MNFVKVSVETKMIEDYLRGDGVWPITRAMIEAGFLNPKVGWIKLGFTVDGEDSPGLQIPRSMQKWQKRLFRGRSITPAFNFIVDTQEYKIYTDF